MVLSHLLGVFSASPRGTSRERSYSIGFASASLALAALGGGCSSDTKLEPVAQSSSALTTVTFAISLPRPLAVTDVALSANGTLAVDDRVQVKTPNGSLANVANASTSPANFGTDTKTGASIYSRGPVILRDRAQVSGGVTTGSTLTRGTGVTIAGAVATNSTTLTPLNSVSWSVTFPAATGAVTAHAGETKVLAPASYGALSALSGGTVKLSAGTYYFTSFDLEPQSSFAVDTRSGPVIVYVQSGSFIYRGALAVTGDPINFMTAYAGSAPLVLEAAYNGTFVAPAASVRLASITQGFTGAFFGRDLEVSPATVVTYRQALPILIVKPPANEQDCMAAVRPRLDLSGPAQVTAYQLDINRICWIPTETPCLSSFVAKENADSYRAAVRLLNQTITPAAYLAVVSDRVRKHRRAEDDPSFANAVCTGTDTDGDGIPDPQDHCANTPDLTATDDNGCPQPTPGGPDPTDLHKIFDRMNVAVNPFCASANAPPEVSFGGFFKPADLSAGVYIFAQRVLNQPPGCSNWYEFEIESTPPAGAKVSYRVAYMDREELTGLVGGSTPIRPQFIQFQARPSDVGTRGLLGSAAGTATLRFRVRAINGAGSIGSWSAWKLTSLDDCFYLNLNCGQ